MTSITYPIFTRCKKFLSDPFWKQIFDDLSRGKTPRGVMINETYIYCSYKDKDFSFQYKGKNESQIYENIHRLFTTRLNIYSQRDQYQRILDLETVRNEIESNKREKWSSIRKKDIKNTLLLNYVIRMKSEHNLNTIEAKKLLSAIRIGIITKVIISKNIIMKDGEIDYIENLTVENGKFYIEDIYPVKTINTKEEDNLLSSKWDKYLKSLSKNIFYNYDNDE